MQTWWMMLVAGQATSASDDLSHFDLAKVKGTAAPCPTGDGSVEDIPTGDVVVCGRKKEMNQSVKSLDWSEKPIRAEIALPGGITASSTVEQRSPGPPGVSVPTPMVHFKIKF